MNRAFLVERDLEIFNLRKSGAPVAEIAKKMGLSSGAVTQALNRQISRLNKEALVYGGGHLDLLRMELERLDHLSHQVWPLAQWRNITLPDGTQQVLEPDLRAVQQVREIIRDRVKLLGLEQSTVQLNLTGDLQSVKASLAGVEKPTEVSQHSAEEEARKLLQVMLDAGIIQSGQLEQLIPGFIEVESEEITEPLEEIVIEEPLAIEGPKE